MTLGRYKIIREIARSNDIVYEALDPSLHRKLAVKELAIPPGFTGPARGERIERFQREARAAGNLKHPNIVTIYEVGEEFGRHFLAMEFLDGETLRQRMNAGPLTPAEAVRIAVALCDALDHAHAHGVVHRDIKPDNIHVLPDGTVKLTDFGIARLLYEDQLTVAGQIFGTPSYMAPEQVKGLPVDARTDVFSLGILLYEMLAGHKPFTGDTVVTITYRIINEPTPPIPGIAPALDQAVRTATQKESNARFPTAGAFARALKTAMGGQSGRTMSGGAPYPAAPLQPATPPQGYGAPNGFPPPGATVAYGNRTQLGVAPGFAAQNVSPPPAYPTQNQAPQNFAPAPPEKPARRWIVPLVSILVVGAAVTAVGVGLSRAFKNYNQQSGFAQGNDTLNDAIKAYGRGSYSDAASGFARVRIDRSATDDAREKALLYQAYTYVSLGEDAKKRGDLASAARFYQAALDAKPDYADAKTQLDAVTRILGANAPAPPSNATPEPTRTTQWPRTAAPGTPNVNANDFVNATRAASQQAQNLVNQGDDAMRRGDRDAAFSAWQKAVELAAGQPSVDASRRLIQYGQQSGDIFGG